MLTSAQISAYATLTNQTVGAVESLLLLGQTPTQKEKDLAAAVIALILLLLDCDGKLKGNPTPTPAG